MPIEIAIFSEISILLKESFFVFFSQSITQIRLITVYLRKNILKLEKFQNYFVMFVTPLPFGYITTVYILRLAKKNNVGQLHQVNLAIYRKSSFRSQPLIQVYLYYRSSNRGSVHALIIGKSLNPSKLPFLDHYGLVEIKDFALEVLIF